MQRRRDIRRAVELAILVVLSIVLVAASTLVAILWHQVEEMFRPAEEIDQEAYQAALQRYYVEHQITPIPGPQHSTEGRR